MGDWGELKIRTVMAGLGLGVILLVILAVFHNLLQTPPGNEAAILFPMLIVLVGLVLVTWLLAYVAFLPMLKVANARTHLFLQELDHTQTEANAIVIRLMDESKRSHDALNQTQQALEATRQSLSDLESTLATPAAEPVINAEVDHSAEVDLAPSIPEAPDLKAEAARVVMNLLAQVTESAKITDDAWQKIVEGQAQLAQGQQRLAMFLQDRRPATSEWVDKPMPREDTQTIIHQISVDRVLKIRHKNSLQTVEAACNEHVFSAKQFKKHVPELVRRWKDKNYQRAWSFDAERAVWIEVEVPEMNSGPAIKSQTTKSETNRR